MDLATIIGLVLCFGLVIFGIVNGDNGIDFSALSNFIDIPSVAITIGGSLGCLLASYNIKDYLGCLKAYSKIFKVPTINSQEIITKIIDLSNVARKEGLLSLEEAASDINDDFLKKGILLIVDGTDPDLVRGIMETELSAMEDRHGKVITFWDRFAAMGPAWGMIGTLVGLVNMLNNMADSSKIGPAMSVALLTTLYGSMMANWIATPGSFKMRNNNAAEVTVKEIMIEGLLSIQAGENPRVIEEKLKSFLAPAERAAASSGEEGEG